MCVRVSKSSKLQIISVSFYSVITAELQFKAVAENQSADQFSIMHHWVPQTFQRNDPKFYEPHNDQSWRIRNLICFVWRLCWQNVKPVGSKIPLLLPGSAVIEFWVYHAVGKFGANSCSQAEKGRKSLMETWPSSKIGRWRRHII